MIKGRTWNTKGIGHVQRKPTVARAIDTCVAHVHEYGAATFMDLADRVYSRLGGDIHGQETMTVGTHAVGNGFTMLSMSNPPNVVVWNGATTIFLEVIEGMLAREPRVVLERTYAHRYDGDGMVLRTHYGPEEYGPRLPVLDFGDPIAADGYDMPHWLPVMFAWAGTD